MKKGTKVIIHFPNGNYGHAGSIKKSEGDKYLVRFTSSQIEEGFVKELWYPKDQVEVV